MSHVGVGGNIGPGPIPGTNPRIIPSGSRTIYVNAGRQVVREGERMLWSVLWAEFKRITSPITTAYRRGSDVSSDVLDQQESSADNIQSLRRITIPAGYGGSTIVIEITVTSGLETRKSAIVMDVLPVGQEGG